MSDQTLADLVDRIRNRFYGKYRGFVTKIGTANEGGVGRIKAMVPSVLGKQETGWCTPCVPYAGKQAAIAFIPEKDAGVWIEFEAGDVSFPIWTGCYWHRDELPSQVAPKVKVIQTAGGQKIVLDDDAGTITVSDTNGNEITLTSKGIKIVRTQSTGDSKVDKGKIEIDEQGVNVCGKNMEVSA